MYTIDINHRNVGKTCYKIYTKKEADYEKLEYMHWKDAKQGQYALSDDGIVAKIIKRAKYVDKRRKKNNTYVRFPWGYHFFNEDNGLKPLNAKGRKSAYTMSGKTYMEVAKGQEKMKNLAMVYAKVLNSDMAIEIAFGVMDDKQKRRWKRMMKTEVFSNMVSEKLSELLGKHALTEEYTIKLLKRTIEAAEIKGDITNLLKAVDNLQDMHGMKDKNIVKTTQKLEAATTKMLVDDIFKEEKLLAEKIEITEKDKS